FGLLRGRQNRPVDHRAVRDHFFDALVQRSQDRCRTAEASADHKDFFGRNFKSLAEGQLREAARYLVHHIKNVEVRRPLQKISAALPGAPVSRIKNPVTLPCQKLHQRLLARDGGHAVAEENYSLLPALPRRRREFRYDLLEPGPEHAHHPPRLEISYLN